MLPPTALKFETLNTALAIGNFFPGEIHGHKFEDLDGDGVEDAGEPRLNGWTIVLTDADGNDVFDADGVLVQPVVTTSSAGPPPPPPSSSSWVTPHFQAERTFSKSDDISSSASICASPFSALAF